MRERLGLILAGIILTCLPMYAQQDMRTIEAGYRDIINLKGV